MIKKLLFVVFILFCVSLCGFKSKEKPFIVLSSGEITQDSLKRIERGFNVGQRINYALIYPDGLKYDGVRLQLSTQNEKTTNYGFSLISTQDLYIDKYSNVYTDYFVPKKSGHYIIQFFYLNKKNYPFAHKEFVVR